MSLDGRSESFVHPLIVRVAHWLNAFATIVMILSGWRIYNAAPLFGFRFPNEMTLGGWLGGALAWHFAGMWVLGINGLAYLVYGVLSGHFWRDLLVIRPISNNRSLRLESKHLLMRGSHGYNPVQRILYLSVIGILMLLVASGLALWKPVQLQGLTEALGGYEQARRSHFFAMAALVAFLIGHVGFALSVPGALGSMIAGPLPRSKKRRCR